VAKSADLHIHSNYSDSTLTPVEIIQAAIKAELSCIAITDHDTLAGIQPAIDAAKTSDLEVLSGIELSSEIQKKDVHILGYLIDDPNSPIKEALDKMQNTRVNRIAEMLDKLKKVDVDDITLDEVCARARSRSVGRPHLAALLFEKGWVKSIRQAFEKYLGEGCLAHVPKFKQTPYEAIELIRKAGGVAVFAHPMLTQLDELIPSFVEAGMQGIEAFYPNCSKQISSYYEGIAKKYNIVATGGSDAHGTTKRHTYIGKIKIPYELVERLKDVQKS
jgi:hypothetical protein